MSEESTTENTESKSALDRFPCQFYMVWNKRGWPRLLHNTLERARISARSLAENNPGRTFIILEAFEKHRVEGNRTEEQGMPKPHPDRALIIDMIETLKSAGNYIACHEQERGDFDDE